MSLLRKGPYKIRYGNTEFYEEITLQTYEEVGALFFDLFQGRLEKLPWKHILPIGYVSVENGVNFMRWRSKDAMEWQGPY
jgi:hypothetical protein